MNLSDGIYVLLLKTNLSVPLHAGARGNGGSPGAAKETQDGERDAGFQEGKVHAGGQPLGTAR